MTVPVPTSIEAADDLGSVHFVGIGGAGLSAIARIMLQRGIRVSGSDAQDSVVLRSLGAEGARCVVGHAAHNLGDADTVVVSTAVRDDNPELVEARARGLRVYPRSAGLQSVLAGRRVVAVAGTHGKTTTTSMLAMALVASGEDPSYAIGAEVPALGTNAHDGSGELFVAEADESDGAFLVYRPWGAVVTNVDADHLDTFGTVAAYRYAFDRFVERIDPDGFLVVCIDDAGGAELAATAREREVETVTVGSDERADVRATDLVVSATGTELAVTRSGSELGRLRLQVPGRHYALDALVALAAGLRCGAPFAQLAAGLGAYAGAKRRMERLGEAGGVRVYDSYAHHPVEIAADLQAARAIAGTDRLVVCFQPHLASRTAVFGAQMGEALGAADEVVVTEIYLAREGPDPSATSSLVLDHVPLPPVRVHEALERPALPGQLLDLAPPGSVVLTLGAGDLTTVGPLLLDLLEGR